MPTPTQIWRQVTGPSAGLVKEHYVRARLQELARRDPALEQKVADILINHSALKGRKMKAGKEWSKELTKVYSTINSNLQTRELTINFKAESWFSTENNYDSYTQMYERSAASSGRKILVGDSQNPAGVRAGVDDKVTVPAAWQGAAPTQRGVQGGQYRGGLSPGANRAGVARQMQFGKHHVVAGAAVTDTIESESRYFNPKTKQVFAALNYGRRPHGSSMEYGDCHLVLHDRFKANAMYYGRDTFFIGGGTETQCAFGMLAAVIAYAHPKMVDDIIKSCYFDIALDDNQKGSTSGDFLLEAHLFEPLTFNGNLKRVALHSRFMGSGGTIIRNALTFARKHGADLCYV